MTASVLGVISAGGASVRYGAPKALATVGGRRVVDLVADALRSGLGGADVVAIVNDPALAAAIGLPHRTDVLEGVGALAGVHAALVWAAAAGAGYAFVAGCDMPLLEPALIARLATLRGDADAVLPASEGPRGVEPLCACYSIRCIAAIEAAAARGDRRMVGFHADVRTLILPLDEVGSYGEPARLFLNLNTPAEREVAERWLEERT
jgi:molybdopterin-guanine dinucleotide biosynthesis protein A